MKSRHFKWLVLSAAAFSTACLFVSGLKPALNATPTPLVGLVTVVSSEIAPEPSAGPDQKSLRFAVIGDYGDGGISEQKVADLVKSHMPDLVITVGDNNYPDGSGKTIDLHIGQFFSDYIYPYSGSYAKSSEINRFFTALGNHDLYVKNGQAYLDYFTLPGNERYYTFTWDNIQFFALNSNSTEPDGFRVDSDQALWLKNEMQKSQSQWQIVYFHHPPFSSGSHGSTEYMRWPFKEWGADLIISGHDHTYERLNVDGLIYIVNGLGGHSRYNFDDILPQSQVRYNADFGALMVEAFSDNLKVQFINTSDEVVDQFGIPIQ